MLLSVLSPDRPVAAGRDTSKHDHGGNDFDYPMATSRVVPEPYNPYEHNNGGSKPRRTY